MRKSLLRWAAFVGFDQPLPCSRDHDLLLIYTNTTPATYMDVGTALASTKLHRGLALMSSVTALALYLLISCLGRWCNELMIVSVALTLRHQITLMTRFLANSGRTIVML